MINTLIGMQDRLQDRKSKSIIAWVDRVQDNDCMTGEYEIISAAVDDIGYQDAARHLNPWLTWHKIYSQDPAEIVYCTHRN